MPIWVRVLKLPLYFFNKLFLSRIGNHIGKTLKVDGTKLVSARGKYARVSVEVDLSKSLILKFGFHRRVKKLEYKGLHVVFFFHVASMVTSKICP